MFRITLTLVVLALCAPTSYAQLANIDYQIRTDYVTSYEGGIGGACWEGGTEEYTTLLYANDDDYTTYTGSCQQCNNNGNCTYANDYVFRSRSNVPAYTATLRLESWEDDGGGRCSYNGGDDCHYGTAYIGYDIRELSLPSNNTWTNQGTHGNGSHDIVVQSTWHYSGSGSQIFPCGDWQSTNGTSGRISSWTVNMTAGRTYNFRTCGAGEDTYLRIYGSNGYTLVASNDDNGPYCGGTAASLDYTAGASGNYYVELARYSRNPLNTNATLEYKMDAGDPNAFGPNQWYVYGYNGRSRDNLSSINYAGYYIDGNLSVNTANSWATGVSPSSASSYIGCPIANDNHTYVMKRQGFPCGMYELSIVNFDDESSAYVNGTQVWLNNGCCSNQGVVWSGYLDASSTMELRTAEGGGLSQMNMTLVDVTTGLSGGAIAGNQSICSGVTPSALTSAGAASGGTTSQSVSYQWEISTTSCAAGFSDIAGQTGLSYTPSSGLTQTSYYRRRATDACGNVSYSSCVIVNVDQPSTAPSIAGVPGTVCPNTNTILTASGGTAGAGSTIEWYTAPNGGGTNLGTGASITVAPTSNTTYYARREGTCNNTTDATVTVNVKPYVYAGIGSTVSTGYCTDNAGWHHFFNGSDEIIFSIDGDLSGATLTPVVTIDNNGSYYNQTSLPWSSCFELVEYEMQRSWNVDFTGTLNPPYNVRFYYPAAERTAIETAAANYIATNPICNYTYEYPVPLGFYWFKNVGSAYSAPLYDATHLTGSTGTVGSTNYAQLTGITSFSGGSGGVSLVSLNVLPVELISFSGYHENRMNYLNWNTATELNNDKFIVERSTDLSEEFVAIAEVKGAGTTNQPSDYAAVDSNPENGVNYYRLKQVDFDGSFEYSNVIAIASEYGEDYALYPNPTKDYLNYAFNSDKKQSVTIILKDLMGRVVAQYSEDVSEGNAAIQLDLTSLVAGNYFITVFHGNNEVIKGDKIIRID